LYFFALNDANVKVLQARDIFQGMARANAAAAFVIVAEDICPPEVRRVRKPLSSVVVQILRISIRP